VAIDQHQAAVRAEAAQRNGGDADRVDGRGLYVAALSRRGLCRVVVRQLVQVGLQVQSGFLLDLFGVDGDQRAGGRQILATDA
jgi:hypothetical protein